MKNHELAERDYILGMSYKDIAQKYNVSIETVKSWKKRHGWERDKPVKKTAPVAPQSKKGCTPSKEVQEPLEELSDKEQLFCYHYVRTWNATQAYLKSGYQCNKAAAHVGGCRLLQRENVKVEIERLRTLFRQEIHVDIQDFLSFCLKVVGADIGDYIRFGAVDRIVFDEDGPMKDENGELIKEPVNCLSLGESEEVDTSVITEVKQGKDGISIKLADKKWAWEQLLKYFDWLPSPWQQKVAERRLEVEKKKVEILEQKMGNPEDAITKHNERIAVLAELLNSPASNRSPEDFDDDQIGQTT